MRRTCLALLLAALVACGDTPRTVVLYDRDAPPARLSAWGVVFAAGRRLGIDDRAEPYTLNTPLFSDYALKFRTAWLPEGRVATLAPDGDVEFPVGTILSKTFYYERAAAAGTGAPRVVRADRDAQPGRALDLGEVLLVETRLLVHQADGWQALPYVWNDAQDEAELAIAGDIRELRLAGRDGETLFSYVVPDMNQCGGCHTPDHASKLLEPLGPQAWQLDRDYAYPDGAANQLARWQAAGLLTGGEPGATQTVNWWVREPATLVARARAYLDANCAHCHNAAGAADTSALHLDREAPLDRHFGICKPPVAVGRGSGDRPYDIYPGRPDLSILVYRMEHSDPAIAMPELGRGVVHTEGVAVVRDWIAQMNGQC
ncbi:MAG: SO2930 family diheme c-type cytochrome [Woeseiaceae bacterium]|nr:SO2930 family diheme c-type cytochrome [Woeseiaceae bacterium]